MLTIYGFKTFNVLKVLVTAEKLCLDYDYIELELTRQEHKTEEHRRRHPLGKVPVIDHDGRYLFESNVICRYLAAVEASALYPVDVYQRALTDQWIDMFALHTGRWIGVLFFEEYVSPQLLESPGNPQEIEQAHGFLAEQLPVIDEQIGKGGYLAGAKLSVADLIAYCYVQNEQLTSLEIDGYANLHSWYRNLAARPAIRRAHERLLGTAAAA